MRRIFKKIKLKKLILIILALSFLGLSILPEPLEAQEKGKWEIPLQIPIPGLTKRCADQKSFPGQYCVKDLGDYIRQFYIYFAGVVGILAGVMVVYAGFQWITAAGNASRIENAKAQLNGATIGVILALSAYLILNTINPNLVSLRMPGIEDIKKQPVVSSSCAKILAQYPGAVDLKGDAEPMCGKSYNLIETSELSFKGTCCGTVGCSGGKVCGSTGQGEEGCPGKCIDPILACKNAESSKCDAVDYDLVTAGRSDIICRKADVPLGKDLCILSKVLDEGKACDTSKGHKQVSCSDFGDLGYRDSPCWNINKPQSVTRTRYSNDGYALSVRLHCEDVRGGEMTDSLCCGKAAKKDIDCRKTSDECNKDEIAVDCTKYNEDPAWEDDDYDSGGEPDAGCSGGECECPVGTKICCMQLYLGYSINQTPDL